MSGVNWPTSAVADFYKKSGSQNPIADACGSGGRQKYHATVTFVDGIRFASKKEARDYQTVKIAEKAGIITDLKLQPKFLLQEAFTDQEGKKHRAVYYVADFQFRRQGEPRVVVADSKGMKTQAYRIKSKLFQKQYPDYLFEEWS